MDTTKTIMQVEGKDGLPALAKKIKARGPSVLFHGALAASSATLVGHYPWCVERWWSLPFLSCVAFISSKFVCLFVFCFCFQAILKTGSWLVPFDCCRMFWCCVSQGSILVVMCLCSRRRSGRGAAPIEEIGRRRLFWLV